jgi:ATP-dependent RNA helicase DDX55/SPB4
MRSKKDRTFLETCEKSFISYLRAYREHHLNYIFAYKDLPLLDILNSFAMLRIPKFPDLPMAHLELEFVTEDTENIPYLNKIKERHRLKKIKKMNKVKTPKQLRAERARAKFGKPAKEERRKLQRARDLENNRVKKEFEIRQQRILDQRALEHEGGVTEDGTTEGDDYDLIQNLKKRKISEDQSYEGKSPLKRARTNSGSELTDMSTAEGSEISSTADGSAAGTKPKKKKKKNGAENKKSKKNESEKPTKKSKKHND